jgi:hypothetical protein
MNKKRSKTRSRGLVKTPRIKNILDVGKRLTPGTLLHVTASQWKQLTSRIPTGKGVPKYGVTLEFYPIPDGDFIGQPMCIQNPCEVCRVRVSGFGPEGAMTFDCQCRPDPNCPQDPPPPPPSPRCALEIPRVGGRLTLGCRSQGCTGRCRLTAVRQGFRYLIV